ncbi:RNA methyltransferase [soil metagenome]
MSLHIALVHFPITDKLGNAVCTSITNLDLHDISRAGTTYGVDGVWLVHPYEAQQRFIKRVLRHWTEGWGAGYNPSRRESLAKTELVDDLGEVVRRIEAAEGRAPILVGTHAAQVANSVSYGALRKTLEEKPEEPVCVVFGTGWGLHPEMMLQMDLMLEPIWGPTDWNHLSVRAAIGIILDRLRGLRHPLFEQ